MVRGYLCGDDALYQLALAEIGTALENAPADGFIGPEIMREKDRWPYMVFFRAVLAQYEITKSTNEEIKFVSIRDIRG